MPTETPWADGPREILDHAHQLLLKNTDTSRRIAMILVDNAVEQIIKTFLNLPKRVHGLTITRRERDEAADSFPVMLDTFEKYASDKLDGVDMSLIDWYHRQRNQLYHEGFGLTIPADTVEVYLTIAATLYKNLFGLPKIKIAEITTKIDDYLPEFIRLWGAMETDLIALAQIQHPEQAKRSIILSIEFLAHQGILNEDEEAELLALRALRNQVVHGMADEGPDADIIRRLRYFKKLFEDKLAERDRPANQL